jgi:DNA-directed RNA polymerase subunit RPC12/RpoP
LHILIATDQGGLPLKELALPVEELEHVTEAPSTGHAERSHRSLCPLCEHKSLKRKPRKGMLHRWISPIFGYYPWHCSTCGGNFLIKKRGKSRKRSSAVHESR